MKQLVSMPTAVVAAAFPAVAEDLEFADLLIARALKKGSWSRNKAWAEKFRNYVQKSCPGLIQEAGLLNAVKSNRIALAFLARVAKEKSQATTRVDAAKRALNFLRVLVGEKPLNKDPCVRLLSRQVVYSTCNEPL